MKRDSAVIEPGSNKDADSSETPVEPVAKRAARRDPRKMLGVEAGNLNISSPPPNIQSDTETTAEPVPKKAARRDPGKILGVDAGNLNTSGSPPNIQSDSETAAEPVSKKTARGLVKMLRLDLGSRNKTSPPANIQNEAKPETFYDVRWGSIGQRAIDAGKIDGSKKNLGVLIGKMVRQGFGTVKPKDYDRFIMESGINPGSHRKLQIVTTDGQQISGLEVLTPGATKTIVVLQGQKGNFQSEEQILRIAQIARETGANVVAFNYRDNPGSEHELINDATAVCGYLLDRKEQKVSPENLIMYGDSLGGAVAILTAVKLKTDHNKDVIVHAARAPKSLSEGLRSMDLSVLLSNKLFIVLDKFKALVGTERWNKTFTSNNWGLNAQEGMGELDSKNVSTMSVKEDQIMDDNAVLKSVHHQIYSTMDQDPHNASLSLLRSGDKSALAHLKELCKGAPKNEATPKSESQSQDASKNAATPKSETQSQDTPKDAATSKSEPQTWKRPTPR